MPLPTFLSNLSRKQLLWIGGAVVLVIACILMLPSPKVNYPVVIEVSEGSTFSEVASLLDEKGVIQSGTLMTIVGKVTGTERSLRAGVFTFTYAESIFSVVYRLVTPSQADVRVTFPEGSSVRAMANILSAALPTFDTEQFITLATEEEGYLFPDTYYFSRNVRPEEAIAIMKSTFMTRTADLSVTDDVVIMASLLEKEARTYEVRQVVAGILWNRIREGMPLQVDAVFGYIKGVDTYHPSGSDLDIDSAYNTYRNRGLPPGPINNPGLESMRAALNPIDTPYRYYLTDNNGTMHYSTTFEGHVRNKRAYLE